MKWKKPEEQFPEEFRESIRGLCLADIPGTELSYHMAEGYLRCPRSILWKTAYYSAAKALGKAPESGSGYFTGYSRDLLGKALMIGLKEGSAEAARDYYTASTDSPAEPLAEEMERRVHGVAEALRKLSGGSAVYFEKEITSTWHGMKMKARIDAVIQRAGKLFPVEIKCTGNPEWIETHSGQLAAYQSLLTRMGEKAEKGAYILLPPWYDKHWTVIRAQSAAIKAPGNQDLRPYREAIRKAAFTPLDEKLWPAPNHPIRRCETCQVRERCKRLRTYTEPDNVY